MTNKRNRAFRLIFGNIMAVIVSAVPILLIIWSARVHSDLALGFMCGYLFLVLYSLYGQKFARV